MKRSICLTILILSLAAAVSAQTAIIPIVELKFRGLLGGVQNGKWVTPEKAAAAVTGDTEFLLVGPNGVEEGGLTLGHKGETEDVCPDFYRFQFELEQDAGVAIGSSAKWNPAPRTANMINPGAAAYRSIVSNFLKKRGIARPVVVIKQAYRIDLEGDGVDEVLITATHYRNDLSSRALVGDYSFVMLRKITGKTVREYLLKGDFILKNIDFGAPSEHEISAIADLNGDGKLEIVLAGSYYEGDFASAFEIRNGKPDEIKEFGIGCGV